MFDVIVSNEHFYVVHKPAGLSFQDEQTDGIRQIGFFNQLCQQFDASLFPVHRLDKITSGLVIVARTKEAAQQFQSMFADKRIEKRYLALIDKRPNKKQGWIKGDMVKSRDGKYRLAKTMENPAITQFVSTHLGEANAKQIRLAQLSPKTGKTHQLRVALKSIGAPIIGDELYGGSPADRGYLHAFALTFTFMGELYQITKAPEQGILFYQFGRQIDALCQSTFT